MSMHESDRTCRAVEAERDLFKSNWERLMAAIGPYSTTDLAIKAVNRNTGDLMRIREALGHVVLLLRDSGVDLG